MIHKNYHLLLKIFSVAVFLELAVYPGLPRQVQALSERATPDLIRTSATPRVIFVPPNEEKLNNTAAVTFIPPTDEELNHTEGAASRGKCSQDPINSSPSLTPVIPPIGYGLTVAKHPTFFIYIPQTDAKEALFVLKNQKEDYYYETILPITTRDSIVKFPLPEDAPSLEIGQNYQWSIVIICGEKVAVDDPAVQGWIQRIETNEIPSAGQPLEASLDLASWYGKSGIWYDTLTTLAELRQNQSDDSSLVGIWEDLLKSVGLEAIATKPLVQ